MVLAVGWNPVGDAKKTKHVFVTGGVASSLGKGLTASSLGSLLVARGLRVTMQKLDPYLNVDPGTMNPFQHGEVFVTEDGAETDLDIGHYERFLDRDLARRGPGRRRPGRHLPPAGRRGPGGSFSPEAGIHVEVRIQFLHGHGQAARTQKHPE